jgi:hypothetical protein
MKCLNSAVNAQGSRVSIYIVVVQVGAVRIYVAAAGSSGGAQGKKETQRWN